jgi:hypothetical protein
MKNVILEELALRWEREAIEPTTEDGSDEAKISNAKAAGYRSGKSNCAAHIRILIDMFPDAKVV